jgi:hypothetical protein
MRFDAADSHSAMRLSSSDEHELTGLVSSDSSSATRRHQAKIHSASRGALALLWTALTLLASCTPSTVIEDSSAIGQQLGEVCDNQLDDDGDDLVDCYDPDCDLSCGGASVPPFAVCGETTGDRGHNPVDMIWVLDGSVSMRDERSSVMNNLNALAGVLDEKRANVRVVLIGGDDVCVKPPLGGPNCQDSDRYRHLVEQIGNDNALMALVERYPTYKSFLRPDSKRIVVAVSDDNPNPPPNAEWPKGVTPPAFDRKFEALDPAFEGYIFHSIVGFSDDGGNHPKGCRGARRKGTTYLALTDHTDGLKFSVCNSRGSDWRDFFEEIGNNVAGLVNVPCTYPLTIPYDGDERTNPNEVQVEAEVYGALQVLERFPDAASCGSNYGYYIEPGADQIRVCPLVCSSIDVTQVIVQHGCPGPAGPD